MRGSYSFGWVALVAAMTGCGGNTPGHTETTTQAVSEARSSKPHDTNPDVSASTEQAAVTGHNAFGFDLYRLLTANAAGNLVFSPTSIEYALAMTYAGARGNTAAQMASALHFDADTPAAYNRLAIDLASRAVPKVSDDADNAGWLELDLVNAAWAQKKYAFVPDYLDLLATHYDAGIKLLDFSADPEGSRATINGFVSDQTHSRIQNLLPPNSLDPLTRLVLTNCVYFWGSWQTPFDANATYDAAFQAASGDVQVSTMHATRTLGYAAGDGWQATELPYTGGKLSFFILLPDAGKLDSVREALTSAWVDAAVTSLRAAPTSLALSLPKFQFDYGSVSLVPQLKALGIEDAFDGGLADFSGMEPSKQLFVSDVFHKAFVQVAEKGTEAAAATAVTMRSKGGVRPVDAPRPFTVDRPFIFLIRDDSGALLFIGEMHTPAAG